MIVYVWISPFQSERQLQFLRRIMRFHVRIQVNTFEKEERIKIFCDNNKELIKTRWCYTTLIYRQSIIIKCITRNFVIDTLLCLIGTKLGASQMGYVLQFFWQIFLFISPWD